MISGLCEIILYSLDGRPRLHNPLGRVPLPGSKTRQRREGFIAAHHASRVALFLQVSDLDVHYLLLPLVRDLCGNIRVRRGIGHNARQVNHFFDLISRTLAFGSHSPKGLGKGMRGIARHGTLVAGVYSC
jgi:hypothetical protein